MVLRNYDEVLQQVTYLLMEWAKESRDYERDIHLYYDEDTQTGKVELHLSSGWLDDGSYILYSYNGKPWYIWDNFSNRDIVDILNVPLEQLEAEIQDYYGMGIDAQLDFWLIRDYLESRDDYMQLIYNAYDNIVEENRELFINEAHRILDDILSQYV